MRPVDSPLGPDGIAGFGRRLRAGETTALQTTEAYLARIEHLDPTLEAFVHVAASRAREAAGAVDRLLAAGTDLGPLMGVPVAIKDLFAVNGMPTRAGSRVDVGDAIGPEGPFVGALKRAGCVILGKTRTIEFAAGAHNVSHPTPWNPCDPHMKKTPGGSSSGSAVAIAARLCALAVGSDTGGSVRVPAALCDVFGLKTSTGLWPLDGIFPLCPTLDTVGLLASSAEDAALAFRVLTGGEMVQPPGLAGQRLGFAPSDRLDLESEVARRYEAALEQLREAGMCLVPVEWPGAEEEALIADLFRRVVPTDLLAALGRERFAAQADLIDPVARMRLEGALDVPATEYLSLLRRQRALAGAAAQRLTGLAGWLVPTAPLVPRPVAGLSDAASASAFVGEALRISRVANACDLCAASIPIPAAGEDVSPVGLQVACRHGEDSALLRLSVSIEGGLGGGRRRDIPTS